MARKVFVSVLGTGFYEPCRYTNGSFVSSDTRFIQQATFEYLKVNNNWTTRNADGAVVDRIIILLTNGAKGTNWDKNIAKRMNYKTGHEEDYVGLEQALQDMNLPCPIETIDIPDGKNEEEMWKIFNAVYDALKPNDELYFDLTHSYRYLPMLVLVLSNYAKFLKDVKVKHISYGNYEARNTETNEAPLMDILPLTMLQDWTFAAADLIQNGNIKKLKELKEDNALIPMLRQRGKQNVDRKVAEGSLNNYINALHNFLDDMKLCLGPNILKGENVNEIVNCHERIVEEFEGIIGPIPPIINKIQLSLHGFEQTDSLHFESIKNGYMSAKWCYDHQLYQQAATILDENITTDFCQRLGTNEHVFKERVASNALLRWGCYREEDWEAESLEGIREKVQAAVSSPAVQDFIKLMRKDVVWIHNDCRNKYNHASMIQGTEGMLTPEDIEKLGRIIMRIIGRIR